MIAVDTNLLVYAHREDSPFHEAALAALTGLAEGSGSWAIPWPCIHEFLAITTHPRIYDPPSPMDTAIQSIEVWMGLDSCRLLAEGPGYFNNLCDLLRRTKTIGPKVHDARIAALCAHHGIGVLWSADRDFSRFPDVRTHNPLVGK